jgi:hypothetical protein
MWAFYTIHTSLELRTENALPFGVLAIKESLRMSSRSSVTSTPLKTAKRVSQHPEMLRSRDEADFAAAVQAAALAGHAHFSMLGAQESTLDILLQYASEPPAPGIDRFAIIWARALMSDVV